MLEVGVTSLLRNLRWQDAVDVSVLTLLFSWIYRWLRRTFAVRVAFGLIALVAGSWIASHLGLILTSYLLSAVGAAATIVIVIVFQHEIRRGLNRLSPKRWLSQGKAGAGPESGRTMIAEAAFKIASLRRGALIVIPRRDSIAEHVTAGTIVDARLSASLIEAIFTSLSPLHDGAIVVSDDRVLRAGVVLPLDTESEDQRQGTRHRAAMGLGRATDALVICVSEEHGTVCLAHGESLEPISNAAKLREALVRLVTVRDVAPISGASARAFKLPGALPHLAIFAGVVLAWAALALDRSHAIARIVPLEIRGVSDATAFDPPRYTSVAVELRSSRRELELLPPDAVEAYVDLGGNTTGSRIYPVVTDAPAGIEVVSVTPASIHMQLRPRSTPATDSAPHPAAMDAAEAPRHQAERLQ